MSNAFLWLIATLYFTASLYYIYDHKTALSVLMGCYAASNIALMYIGR